MSLHLTNFSSSDAKNLEKSKWILNYAHKKLNFPAHDIAHLDQVLNGLNHDKKIIFLNKLKNAWRSKKYKDRQLKGTSGPKKKAFNILLPTETISAIKKNSKTLKLTQSEYLQLLVTTHSLNQVTPSSIADFTNFANFANFAVSSTYQPAQQAQNNSDHLTGYYINSDDDPTKL